MENSPPDISKSPSDLSIQEPLEIRGEVRRREIFVGPLPPPEMLERYKAVLPDAPERIFAMAEKEQESHIHMRGRYGAYLSRGQHYALVIMLAVLLFHAFLAYLGQGWLGFLISGPVLLGIVGSFIYGNLKKEPPKEDGRSVREAGE